MSDIAISVQNVSKSFKLPHERYTGIKQALINFRPGHKGYQIQEVLKGINFDINKGEFFGIVGRNGSGKSTLLKLLAHIYYPEKGGVHINGSLTPFIELGVGFNPELTGKENVYLNGALLGLDRKQTAAVYDEIVDFAELHDFMDQKLKNYSSGMQVRLAFSVAIRATSDILLVDEVLAVGDSAFQAKCFDYFYELKKAKRTVILVSHDLDSIQKFCDRVAIVDRGVLVDVGPAEEMVIKYQTEMADGTITSSEAAHQGTGDYVIDEVEVLDSKGAPTKSLMLTEAFTVRTHVTAHKKVEAFVCGVSVDDPAGESIIGPNTKEANIKLDGLASGTTAVIDTVFKTNPLAAGRYSVTLGIFNKDATVPYDYFKHAQVFNVIGKATHGKVNVESEWKITPTAR